MQAARSRRRRLRCARRRRRLYLLFATLRIYACLQHSRWSVKVSWDTQSYDMIGQPAAPAGFTHFWPMLMQRRPQTEQCNLPTLTGTQELSNTGAAVPTRDRDGHVEGRTCRILTRKFSLARSSARNVLRTKNHGGNSAHSRRVSSKHGFYSHSNSDKHKRHGGGRRCCSYCSRGG